MRTQKKRRCNKELLTYKSYTTPIFFSTVNMTPLLQKVIQKRYTDPGDLSAESNSIRGLNHKSF